MIGVPERTEAGEYYFVYINQVPAGDVRKIIAAQKAEAVDLFRGISSDRSLHRYAPDKWTIRETVNHVIDTERVFGFRALWFARGFDSPLPSFDQDIAVSTARPDQRSWQSLIDEFDAVRGATTLFFQSLADDDWMRRGLASGNPFTVRALAYMTAGHVTHHLKILKERYL